MMLSDLDSRDVHGKHRIFFNFSHGFFGVYIDATIALSHATLLGRAFIGPWQQ